MIRSAFPVRSPTTESSWASATRITRGEVSTGARLLLTAGQAHGGGGDLERIRTGGSEADRAAAVGMAGGGKAGGARDLAWNPHDGGQAIAGRRHRVKVETPGRRV